MILGGFVGYQQRVKWVCTGSVSARSMAWHQGDAELRSYAAGWESAENVSAGIGVA
jgi:hypothetical protein